MSSADKNRIYSKIFLFVVFIACPLTVALGSVVFGAKDLIEGAKGWWEYLLYLAIGVFVLRFVYVTLTSKDSRSVYERAVGEYWEWFDGMQKQSNELLYTWTETHDTRDYNALNEFQARFDAEKQQWYEHLENVRTDSFFNNVMHHTK